MIYRGLYTSWATPKASFIELALGSIINSFGETASSLTSTLEYSSISLDVVSVPSTGFSTGRLCTFSSVIILAIPVPYIAPLRNTSHKASLAPVDSKSSCNRPRIYSTSCLSSSSWSSWISNQRPLPNVASSSSATLASTACCRAGIIILDFSDTLFLSSAVH